ncbi:MAG: amino acid permease, partial [Alphaproteobacteria bacterium]|nr:amino acid permease [Alphaproteobacteria bacterium]
YALAAGAGDVLGPVGTNLVILGALLATSSAISGTLFGASRQIAAIARDGYFPTFLAQRVRSIPVFAILTMSGFAFLLVLAGSLRIILEFGSVTFLLVSCLMAYTNHKIRKQTKSSPVLTIGALTGLMAGTALIIYYEATTQVEQLYFIGGIYALLTVAALGFARARNAKLAATPST